MSWRDHLQGSDERRTLPWTGGRSLPSAGPEYSIEGRTPPEHGWHEFRVRSRKAEWVGRADPRPDLLKERTKGYLVGDRIVPDGSTPDPDPSRIAAHSETVHALDPGLPRFARVLAGRVRPGAPLVFVSQEMPEGPEQEVLASFQEKATSVAGIKGVSPALDASFRMESWRREEQEKARVELERARAEEERRSTLADARGRRAMAAVDFSGAARAALAVSGAEYLDHRPSHAGNEMVVTYRVDGRRLECVCDSQTLRIVDAGVCLVDYRTREKGDTRFTLESLPGVIRQAVQERVLVVLRHVGQEPGFEDEDEDEDEEDW